MAVENGVGGDFEDNSVTSSAPVTVAGETMTGVSREDHIDAVANDILVKLPPDFDIEKTRKKFVGSSISPTSVVLLQELERFNNLLSRMRKSLSTLRKVVYSVLFCGCGNAPPPPPPRTPLIRPRLCRRAMGEALWAVSK